MAAYKDLPALTAPVFLSESVSYPIFGNTCEEWRETYIVLKANFVKPLAGTQSTRHAAARLVEIAGVQDHLFPGSGVLVYTLVFCTVPATYSEPVTVAHTFPGLSSGTGAKWNPYGRRKPFTLAVTATDTFTFDSTPPALDPLTLPYYGSAGDRNYVDFFGLVYDKEDPYSLIGPTVPGSEPGTYTIASTVELWRGDIYRKTTRTVSAP